MFVFRQVNRVVNTPTDVFLFGTTEGASTSYVIKKWDGSSFSTMAATLANPGPLLNMAASTIGTTSYLFGGSFGNTYYNTIQRYVANGARTTESAVLSTTMVCWSASTLQSNIFIFGGVASAGDAPVDAIQRYDGANRTTDTATLQATNFAPASTVFGSYAYIFGGNAKTTGNAIQKYDGTTRTTDVATLSSATTQNAATTLRGAMIIFGPGNLIQRYDGTTASVDSATLAQGSSGVRVGTRGEFAYIFVRNSSYDPYNWISSYNGSVRSSLTVTMTSTPGCATTVDYGTTQVS